MYEKDGDNSPKFASGDQDYESATGWDPIAENVARIKAEALKNDPRAFAPSPEMLWVREAQYYIGSGIEDGVTAQLFGPFWLRDETAILFAPPGVGKSVLATQIAESIARGVPLAPFADGGGPKVGPMRVLYLDFELSRWQFTQRYTVAGSNAADLVMPYQFSPNFLRAELYWDGRLIDGYEDYTDMLFEDIGNRVNEAQADVLIVDNITFLTRGSTANAAIAFRLMDRLRDLKRSSDVSVLIVAHTPKRRRPGLLTENDLQGSIDLAKVADSVFALGSSRRGSDLRYLKHIKCRTGQMLHGTDNIAVYRLAKLDLAKVMQIAETDRAENFLGLDFVEFGSEFDHVELTETLPKETRRKPRHAPEVADAACALAAEGKNLSEIAAELGIGRSTAHRYVNKV